MTMDRKVKSLITIIIIFLSFLYLEPNFDMNKQIESNKKFTYSKIDNLKIAGYWNLTGSPIYIDDTDPDYSWNKIASENEWCSGSGTLSEPYLIENVTIDGLNSYECIVVKNSLKYFKIKNCTLYNSITGNDYAGIKLRNASNGKLLENDLSFNNGYGLRMISNSNNNTVNNNKIINSRGGIFVDHSKFNNITGNSISETTWNSGLYLWYSANNTIHDNNVSDNGIVNLAAGGIRIDYSNENNLTNNIVNYNSESGIHVSYSDRNRIEGNIVTENYRGLGAPGIVLYNSRNNLLINNSASKHIGNGIVLYDSDFNSLISNNASKNEDSGFYLSNSHNNNLSRNIANENTVLYDKANGIEIYDSDSNFIFQNIMIDNEENGILLRESYYNNVSSNYLKDSYLAGIRLEISQNNTLHNNTLYSASYGIIVYSSDYNMIIQNNATENGADGIYLPGSSHNKILKNSLNKNGLTSSPSGGISLGAEAHHNFISENTINENEGFFVQGYGISLTQSYSNIITKNNLSDNYYYGIYLNYESVNNSIDHNIIKDSIRGISIRGLSSITSHSVDNNLTQNTLFHNEWGLYFDQYSHNSTIEGNYVINNTQYGIFLNGDTEGNMFYENLLVNNSIHAKDNGMNNYWNSSLIGNYWDNYTGLDANDDGIGDTPYVYIQGSSESQDFLPIWEDTDDIAPIIDINFPKLNQKFGSLAPIFNVSIDEYYLNTSWYTLNGGKINTFDGLIGQIDQTQWTALPSGIVTITFFVNDSLGRIDSDTVNIYKDTLSPNITIISPLLNEILGIKAPNFNISILDSNLDSFWYSLDNGVISTTNITASSLTGRIDQSFWDYFGDGTLTIKFYANDTLGNIGKKFITVIKDDYEPEITINSPMNDEIFGDSAPSFNVRIFDLNIHSMWYTLDGGLNNYSFWDNGTINLSAWSGALDGPVKIIFYANDTAGNIGYMEINIIKDTNVPVIIVNSPSISDVYGDSAPTFNVRITEPNLDSMWYTIDSGLNNYSFMNNGTINLTAWLAAPDGFVNINFYVNDTAGNIGTSYVIVVKDSTAPIIIVNSPIEDEEYGSSPPSFNLRVIDVHLDKMWYSFDDDITNYIFTSNTTINQAVWDELSEGIITIRFYANDTIGNLSFEEITITKNIPSDGFDPTLVIIVTSIGGGFAVIIVVYLFMKKRKMSG